MENPCRIVALGDSITRAWAPLLERRLRSEYPENDVKVINEGVVSDTSLLGLERLATVLEHRADVVLIGFGMNDWRKGVERPEFREALAAMVDRLIEAGCRVLLVTINPDWQGRESGTTTVIDRYNEEISNLAHEKKVRIVDVNSAWKRRFPGIADGLEDEIHPNARGYELIVDALMTVLPRVSTTVVWQYNGHYGLCNYRCPYCYYPTKKHYFRHTIEEWKDGFLALFGRQRVTFYLSYGEPMLGKNFYEVLDLIGSEPQWDCIITTNLSVSLERMCRTRLVQEGRLEINASYHPTQRATQSEFLAQLFVLREHGIEAPVVYVMYPEQIPQFPMHFRAFDRHGFFMHIRRFRGRYKGRFYPDAFSADDRHLIASYMDRNSIRLMLSNPSSAGRLSYAGMFYLCVDNDGNVARSPESQVYGDYGNIVDKTARLDVEPQPLAPGVREGSVDGSAAILDGGIDELTGNHIWSYATQGGVRRDNGSIRYPYRDVSFLNPRVLSDLGWGAAAWRLAATSLERKVDWIYR
jgi:lysophospholipase L1-like esterase